MITSMMLVPWSRGFIRWRVGRVGMPAALRHVRLMPGSSVVLETTLRILPGSGMLRGS
jgi:hypothetical protein